MVCCIHSVFVSEVTSTFAFFLILPIKLVSMTYNISAMLKVLSIILICSISSTQAASDQSALSNILSTVLNRYVNQLKTTNTAKNDIESPETRGHGHGGGHGGGGGHGHGYGAITLDPVSIISLLALGAFLINNILQLLRANQMPAAPAPAPMPPGKRSFDETVFPDGIISRTSEDYNDKNLKNSHDKEPSFSQFFENVGSLYYLQPKKRNICIKKVVCRYVNAQKSREDGQGTFKIKVFDFMLSAITRFVAPELNAESLRDDACGRFNKLCSDSLLADAKTSVENKVYAEVSTLISNLAVKQLVG